MTTSFTIPALQEKVERLRHDLKQAEVELRDAQADATGFKHGDIVNYRGTEHRITRIDGSWGKDKPWLHGNPKKKDGTWGTRVVHMYSDYERR